MASHRLPRSARCIVTAACLAAAAAAQGTWHVDDSNPACPGSGTAADPFCTIAAALDAAAPGDTIEVAGGTYFESVTISKDALTLRGAGATLTTIVGDPASTVVGPSDFGVVASFTLEGFRITSSDPGPALIIGVWVEPINQPGAVWQVRDCLVEDVDTGMMVNDVLGGAQASIENCVVRHCGQGMLLVGQGVAIRHCTVVDIEGVGIDGGLPNMTFEVSDSIIASTGAWAIERYWNAPTVIQRVLVHDTNRRNPTYAPSAGPFVQYLAEGYGGGIYMDFLPTPGPALEADPVFVAQAGGDLRLAPGSPAIDEGASEFDPTHPYDLLGYGHLRLDDGDFDGVERTDLGAIEFGGLLLNGGLGGELDVGQVLAATQAGQPGAVIGVFAGLPGAPLALGAKGTFFLAPSPLLLIATGILPAEGATTAVSGIVPAAAAGLELTLQATQKAGGALHWTNLERVAIGP